MKALKRYWYTVLVLIITIGLGVVVFLTSQKLQTTKPVAPNAPQATPKAANLSCTLQFTVGAPSTPTPTPVSTSCVAHFIASAPTSTPTPAPTYCNGACSGTSDCASGLVCTGGVCRNPSCTTQTNCTCQVVATPTPPPVSACNYACTVNTDCASGLVCITGACRNPSCTDRTNCTCVTATPTPAIPVTGSGPTVLGATVIGSGAFLLLLGLLF